MDCLHHIFSISKYFFLSFPSNLVHFQWQPQLFLLCRHFPLLHQILPHRLSLNLKTSSADSKKSSNLTSSNSFHLLYYIMLQGVELKCYVFSVLGYTKDDHLGQLGGIDLGCKSVLFLNFEVRFSPVLIQLLKRKKEIYRGVEDKKIPDLKKKKKIV